jgi:phosphate starvation-inducible protein PhoH
MKKTVTRIANGGKIVLMGDRRQIDLRKDKDSGLFDLINFKNKDFAIHELSICHRHPIVNALCEYYDSLTPA